jgi:hypothetical protein
MFNGKLKESINFVLEILTREISHDDGGWLAGWLAGWFAGNGWSVAELNTI